MTTRPFTLGAILSVTTGILVAPGGMAEVHEILDFMTGDQLFTHQLIRACEECAPALRAQHPDLPTETPEGGFAAVADIETWLAELATRYGAHRPVAPLAAGDHTRIDPVTELAMMRPDMPVIVVAPEGATQ